MSAGAPQNDSRDPLSVSGSDHPEAGNGGAVSGVVADAAVSETAPPKARTKRPRPTFDDGTLTRLFKFPSKTYPRSTYYVTATEIIIRIRKARKKWKLVIPKKRLVSYRTNRWFAKPRFVEVELTFTQATRLGLVAPRAKPKAADEPVLEMAAVPTLPVDVEAGITASDASLPCEPVAEAALESEGSLDTFEIETDSASPDEAGFELEADTGDEDVGDDDVFEPENDEELGVLGSEPDESDPTGEPELVQHDGGSAVGQEECLFVAHEPALIAPAEVIAKSPPVTLAELAALAAMRRAPVQRPAADRPARRPVAMVLSGLVLLLAGAATVWHTQGDRAGVDVAGVPPCAPTANCAVEFVTGSLKSSDRPSTPETEQHPAARDVIGPVVEVPEPAAPVSPIGTGEADRSAPSPSPAPEPEPIKAPDAQMQPDIGDAGVKPAQPDLIATAVVPAIVAPVAADVVDGCKPLPALARAIDIGFDFASASLDAAIIPAIDAFATQLRACATATVIIEGHADADGDPDRNQGLSVRRAQAVREHLVNAGLRPEQLWMIGFGQSRPTVPNDTADNKRRNRRAVLTVELPPRD